MAARITFPMAICVLAGLVAANLLSACTSRPADLLNRERAKPAATAVLGAYQPISTLLYENCAIEQCHNREHLAAWLDLNPSSSRGNLINVKSSQKPAEKLVIPGEPQHSYLLAKIRGDKGIKGTRMPIGHPFLTPEQEKLVEDWIANGARE